MKSPKENVSTSVKISRALPKNLRHPWDLLALLVRRDLRLRYRHSMLGVMWSVLLPVAQAAVLVFVFQILVPLDIEAYPAFVFAGLLPWTWFSNSVVASSSTFLENRELVRHPGFWPPALIIVTVLSNLILYLAAIPILLLIAAFYGRTPTAATWLLPILLLVQAISITGVGLITSTLNVFYRDVSYVVAVVLMLLFYLTPVFYEAPKGHSVYHVILLVNPVGVLVDSYRMVLFNGGWPDTVRLATCTIISTMILVAGWRVWKRNEQDAFDTL